MVSEGAVLDWSALYLRQELGSDIATAGLAFAAFSGAMALMRFLGDGVRNRFGAVNTLRASALVAAAGLLVAGLSPGPWPAIAAFAFAGSAPPIWCRSPFLPPAIKPAYRRAPA